MGCSCKILPWSLGLWVSGLGFRTLNPKPVTWFFVEIDISIHHTQNLGGVYISAVEEMEATAFDNDASRLKVAQIYNKVCSCFFLLSL
jgi:hypothetical protein